MTALHPIVAKILADRGFDAARLEEYFDPSFDRLIQADSIPGLTEAVRVILPFVASKRKIVVFGDYDCDGVCATAIMVTTLRKLGADAAPFIPDRFAEGYGMTAPALKRLLETFPDVALVLTVDNGVNAIDEVAELKARGIAVAVTDHHLPGPELPKADALVDPKVKSVPGCENLCGAGIAFFLSNVLVREATQQGLYSGGKISAPLLVLAGMATVSDVMPLVNQNRILVSLALRKFFSAAPLGIVELYQHAARAAKSALRAFDFGFLLAPRINAAGRMASAMRAYELVMCDSRERARQLAVEVDGYNAERKKVENELFEQAERTVPSKVPAALAINAPEGHAGVAGIVAARLVEKYGVPVAIFADDHGSARAAPGYNVRDALQEAHEALVRFGGHAAAGGFGVKDGQFERFRELFVAACARQSRNIPHVDFPEPDLWVSPEDLSFELLDSLQLMEPFGEGNAEPIFGLKNIVFSDIRTMGIDQKHASFKFQDARIPPAKWWGHGGEALLMRAGNPGTPFDVLFKLTSSVWGSESPYLELTLVHVRPSENGISAAPPAADRETMV